MKYFKKIIFLFGIICYFNFRSLSLAISPIGSWTTTSNLPYSLANHPATVFNNKLFALGGSTTFVRSETISSFILPDGSLSNWETSSSIPLPINLFWHSLINKGNFIYILGGATYPPENSVNRVLRGFVDPSGNIITWVEMTSLPQRLAGGSSFLIGDKIYFTGGATWTNGWSGVTISNLIYVSTIDASGNLSPWQIAGTLPNPSLQHTAIYTGNKVIIIGGTTNTSYSPISNVYSSPINPDGTIGPWQEISPLKFPNRYPMVNIAGNYVILAGGWTNTGPTDEVYYSQIDASGNTGEWFLSANKLQKKNCCTGSTAYNNYMYITGGHDGSIYYNSVWIAPVGGVPTPTPTQTPTPTPPIPIVFLPGLGASFNFKEMFFGIDNPDGWKMTPGANIYKNIIKTFEGKDYFHIFYYDWRRTVLESSQKLHDYIQDEINPPDDKVNLIGHSLGGLVARTCVQKKANNCYVNKLITVGSPHSGAVDTYPAIEGGEIWRTGLTKLGYELLVHFNQKPGETKRDTLERIAPVLKDLLPNFDYLTKNGNNLPPAELSYQNTLLPQLTNLGLLFHKTQTISGRDFQTVETINLIEPNWWEKALNLWKDGKPESKILTLEGDTSVLVKSASFNNQNIPNFIYNLNHGGIISEQIPLEKILETLGLSIPVSTGALPSDSENYLVFFVQSPVKLLMTELPENTYTEDELVLIPDPVNKYYQISLYGTGDGDFRFSIGQIFGQNVYWNDYYGNINSEETIKYEFDINIENPKSNPLLDPTGKFTQNNLAWLINSLKNKIKGLGLKPFLYRSLYYKISTINLKNSNEAFFRMLSFRKEIAELEKQKIINSQTADEIRQLCSEIIKKIEELLFLKKGKVSQYEAKSFISQAEKSKPDILENPSHSFALIFQEAEKRLNLAKESYASKKYLQVKYFSLESSSLFSEAKILF